MINDYSGCFNYEECVKKYDLIEKKYFNIRKES